jgi:hypothetical protein
MKFRLNLTVAGRSAGAVAYARGIHIAMAAAADIG